MAKRTNLQERYELKEVLGRGGMGVVYRALDTIMQREVALKTILDVDNPALVEMFYKEWSVLTAMVHPNVISIYDIGEFEHEGLRKPFFVMPLLPGVTLDKLIRDGSPRLSVENAISMVTQAARGLQAAHELGLIHRDIKPSNIFVLDDDSVKIIDFGIARSSSTFSKTALKGTLYYLAPEQLQLKPPSPQSDIYALGVVCYETLTRRRPFLGATDDEVVQAILHSVPPPVSEINQNVKFVVSQVVHKAMAKNPWHRFATAREFGDALQKAARGEALEYFDTSKVKARVERAAKSFEEGDLTFSGEILTELEGEGHLDPSIGLLRRRLDETLRQTRIRQLLDSSRRFFETQEYTLALRKIQEALEIDPQSVDVLTLKNQIENERRQKKIVEWIEIARQHLANNAFRQAREALENVLKVKSTDTQTLNLLEEVRRRENEFEKNREEKSRLYQGAMQAWQRGEITSALSKLQVLVSLEHDLPDSDSARSSTYQNFYNQVHSEHDALRNGYDEARQRLVEDNFEAALALCTQFLGKYPNHALFQALKFDVEERQRQKLSSVIAETDRRVEEEPDLDKRAAILDEILKQYPGESHFERALRLTKDKRDLVNSIVAKARYFEERGQLNEACDQWQILCSIHTRYPGLQFEIERLKKRRDQQAHEDARAKWVEEIDRQLEETDYERAQRALERALAEFPEDPELLELAEVLRKCRDREVQSKALIEQARGAAEDGDTPRCLELLRKALQVEPRNPVGRAMLVNALLEEAKRLLSSDMSAAESCLQEILRLEPGNTTAQGLQTQVSDHKREQFVAWCLSQARRLQGDGDIGGALAILSEGMAQYPSDPRLQRLQALLVRAQTNSSAEAAPAAPPAAQPEPVNAPQPTESVPPPPKVEEKKEPIEAPTAPPPQPAASPPAPRPASKPGVASQLLAKVKLPPALESRKVWLLLVAVAVTLLLLIVGAVQVVGHFRGRPVPAGNKVSVRVSVPEAQLFIDDKLCGAGQCEVQLTPGTHRAEARLAGYATASTSVEIPEHSESALNPVVLTLVPTPPVVVVSSDIESAKVLLNGAAAGETSGVDVQVKELQTGECTLELVGKDAKATVSFKVSAGSAPEVGRLDAPGLKAFVLTGLGPSAQVFSNTPGTKLRLDGNPAGALSTAPLALPQLTPGVHELVIELGNGAERKISFESGGAPLLIAAILLGRTTGTLLVATGEDGVTVTLNDAHGQGVTQKGSALFNLPPGTYTVHAEKAGFLPAPDQTVEVKKGQESRVAFKLTPAPRRAALRIQNGLPGAEVELEGKRIGLVDGNGNFSFSDVVPGRHAVGLKKETFKARGFDLDFVAGQTQTLDGGLQSLMGQLKIEVTPAGTGAKIVIRREGDTAAHAAAEGVATLAEGLYQVTASARGYSDSSTTVRLTGGGTATARVEMQKVAEPQRTAPQLGMADVERQTGWVRDGQTLTRRGGDYVFFPSPSSAGSTQLSLISVKGKRLEFLVNWRNDRNHIRYEVEDDELKRIEVVMGKKTETNRKIRIDRKTVNLFRITVTADLLELAVSRGTSGRWETLDKVERAGNYFYQGRLGLRVPGRDEVALYEFSFTPR